MARMLVIAGALLAALSPAVAGSVHAASATVRIGEGLDPVSLQIAPGTTVTWMNESGNRHRMRSTSGPGEFDSGNLEPGESYRVTFTAAGTWRYQDERDDENGAYKGTITVSSRPVSTPSLPPGSTAPPAAAPPPGDIRMAGRAFSPGSITIDAGTTLRWRNDDDREHTVTATDGSFDSGTLGEGATWTREFTTAGTYPYLCVIHPEMTGTIAVRGAAGAPPPAAPPTPRPTPTPAPTVPPAAAPDETVLEVRDFAFAPSTIEVAAGVPVTWINAGAAPHTITAADGAFDSGMVVAGDRWSTTFDDGGTFALLCAIHPEMTATLVVVGPGPAESVGPTRDASAAPVAPGRPANAETGATADAPVARTAPSGSGIRLAFTGLIAASAVSVFGLLVRGTVRRGGGG